MQATGRTPGAKRKGVHGVLLQRAAASKVCRQDSKTYTGLFDRGQIYDKAYAYARDPRKCSEEGLLRHLEHDRAQMPGGPGGEACESLNKVGGLVARLRCARGPHFGVSENPGPRSGRIA